MAEVGNVKGNEEVQAYLEQHKITSLFESLMSKVVKERPVDPLEFLVGKLQAMQRQRMKGISPAHTTASSVGSRSKIQVTGISVTPKSSATAKARSTDHATKMTGTRPIKPRTPGMTSSSTSALKRSIPTKITPSKTTPSQSRPVTSASGLKTPTSIPKASRRPITAPGGSRASSSAVGRGSAAVKKKETKPPSSLGKSPASSTSSLSKPAKNKAKSAVTKVKVERGRDSKPASQKEASDEKISEFFGEAKKSSLRQIQVDPDEDSEFEGTDKGAAYSDSDESDSSDGMLRNTSRNAELDLEDLIQKRQKSRCNKKSHRDKVQSLLSPSPPNASSSSLGYHSDSQDEEDETDSGESQGVEFAEDYAALEDEGVTGLSRGKYAVHKAPPTSASAKVDLKVVICSHCARVIADGDPVTEVTASHLTHTVTHSLDGGDFESASQVGGRSSFPQWEAGSALSGSGLGGSSSARSHDLSSDVTVQSCDSWGGLAPPTRVQGVPSDTDSEVQLPAPPPLEGKSWLQDPPSQHDPHGWAALH